MWPKKDNDTQEKKISCCGWKCSQDVAEKTSWKTGLKCIWSITVIIPQKKWRLHHSTKLLVVVTYIYLLKTPLPLQENLLQMPLSWTFGSSVFRAGDSLRTDTDVVTNGVLPPLLCQHELCRVYQTEIHLPEFIPDIHCVSKCISNRLKK